MAIVILGHDVFMATDAHAAEPGPLHHVDHQRPSTHRAIMYDGIAGVHEPVPQPSPNHSGACGVARAVDWPSSPHTGSTSLAGVISAEHASETPRQSTSSTAWAEPTAPPGTRRALFQVYLI
jgi:hypothetical protein